MEKSLSSLRISPLLRFNSNPELYLFLRLHSSCEIFFSIKFCEMVLHKFLLIIEEKKVQKKSNKSRVLQPL